jgi:hypothetical protein
MAALAKGLPVVFIPEQLPVAPVRNDVIDNGRRGYVSFSQTLDAQRMPV